MILEQNLYSVFDSKMASFSAPFIELRDAGAIRNFTDWCNDGSNPQNMLFKHPEDYTLYRLGSFDNEQGTLIQKNPPEALVTASAVRDVAPEMDTDQLRVLQNGKQTQKNPR